MHVNRGNQDRYGVRLGLYNVVFKLACTAEKEVEVKKGYSSELGALLHGCKNTPGVNGPCSACGEGGKQFAVAVVSR